MASLALTGGRWALEEALELRRLVALLLLGALNVVVTDLLVLG